MFESGSVGECIHTSTSTSTSASEHFQCLSVFDLPALDLFDLNDARPKNEVRASCGPAVIESNVSVAKVLVRAAVQSIPICERLMAPAVASGAGTQGFIVTGGLASMEGGPTEQAHRRAQERQTRRRRLIGRLIAASCHINIIYM